MTSRTALKALTLLRSAELTKGMETEHLKKLAAIAREVIFAEDEIIYHRGNVGRGLYLIENGEIAIETDLPGQTSTTLKKLGPGQFFGWSSLFPREQKIFYTRATKPTRAVIFNAQQMRDIFSTDSRLEYAVVRRAGNDMVGRIRATRQQLADLFA